MMLRKLKTVMIGLLLVGVVGGGYHSYQSLCSGFMPKNDLWIPEGDKSAGGLSEEEFNAVIDKLDRIYRPIISGKGGELVFSKYWSDGTVNASAIQWFGYWYVNMYGGMARHKLMTSDSFAMVACHELGHHLGGLLKSAAG